MKERKRRLKNEIFRVSDAMTLSWLFMCRLTLALATEEISRLKEDLDHEVVVRSRREKELVQLRDEQEKKGSETLKRDSELQQKEFAL